MNCPECGAQRTPISLTRKGDRYISARGVETAAGPRIYGEFSGVGIWLNPAAGLWAIEEEGSARILVLRERIYGSLVKIQTDRPIQIEVAGTKNAWEVSNTRNHGKYRNFGIWLNSWAGDWKIEIDKERQPVLVLWKKRGD